MVVATRLILVVATRLLREPAALVKRMAPTNPYMLSRWHRAALTLAPQHAMIRTSH
ncbi:conserved hypothetical protein [Desulfarculales bacterium]